MSSSTDPARDRAGRRASDEVPLELLQKQLANRQALDLAADGPRDRSSRQRTLRDAIAWSVALLPEELAGRFARLAVFDGGFTAEAAAAVAAVTAADLTALVRASLVVAPATGDTGCSRPCGSTPES